MQRSCYDFLRVLQIPITERINPTEDINIGRILTDGLEIQIAVGPSLPPMIATLSSTALLRECIDKYLMKQPNRTQTAKTQTVTKIIPHFFCDYHFVVLSVD